MRSYADLLDKVESVLLPAYAQKTGKTTDEIAPCWRMKPGCPVPNVWHTDLLTR